MAAEYRLGRRARACMECGKPFEPGQPVVTAIYEPEEPPPEDRASAAFTRSDLCEGCFASARPAFSHWLGRHPGPPAGAGKLDFGLALEFFRRLVREADPGRETLAYTLALLLARKRRVRIRHSRPLPGGTLLELTVPGDEEDETVRIRAPEIDAEQAAELQEELARLFGFESAAPDPGPDGPPA